MISIEYFEVRDRKWKWWFLSLAISSQESIPIMFPSISDPRNRASFKGNLLESEANWMGLSA